MLTSPPPSKRQKLDSTPTSFAIDPLSQFAGPCAVIKQPIELTCFSYDKRRQLHHDTSSMVDISTCYSELEILLSAEAE
jgi:hypothetical protein